MNGGRLLLFLVAAPWCAVWLCYDGIDGVVMSAAFATSLGYLEAVQSTSLMVAFLPDMQCHLHVGDRP